MTNDDRAARDMAQVGLRLIEDAIMVLLSAHPEGLRNSEVAELLDLRSGFRGRQKDYLTYSVLGGLLAQGRVAWDAETKIFTTASGGVHELHLAQTGLRQLEDAILALLELNTQGLRNSEIAEFLNLRSSFKGRQQDYLTYSVLGGLLARGTVSRDERTKLYTKSQGRHLPTAPVTQFNKELV